MEIILGICTFLGGIAAVWFFMEKHAAKNNHVKTDHVLNEISEKLEQIGVGLDSNKNMRAIKYLSEGGYGNQHYRDFLLWAFSNLEKGIIAAFKATSFDSLCKDNGITVKIVDDTKGRELFLEVKGNASSADIFWNGNSYFYGNVQETFGAYFKERKIAVNITALEDFRKLHELFINYINETLSDESIHKEISPDGMVPPNY